MNIREPRRLHTIARHRQENAPAAGKVVLIHAALILGMSLLSTLITWVLELRIDQSGGLSNLGLRSVLSTFQSVLPLVISVVTICLDVGYMAAMLRVARRQYTSPQTLRLGFDRFWVLLRYTLFRGFLIFAIGFVSIYAGVMVYLATPLSSSVVELLAPHMNQSTLLSPGVTLDEAVAEQVVSRMTPAFLIIAVFFLIGIIPLLMRYRLVNYLIIDHPDKGALAAMRESRSLMRGNWLAMLRVDLTLWWYFLALIASSVVCYGDVLLPNLGITLPFSPETAYFLFYVVYLGLMFVIYRYLRPHAEIVYALTYESLKPEEPPTDSVVLGNIFQM